MLISVEAAASQPKFLAEIAPSRSLQTGGGHRIPALDGLRGLASLLVVAYHFGPHITPERTGAVSVLKRASGMVFSGVDLFFVLSGFLIAGILMDTRQSGSYYRTFYVRRICRIFPLYYVVLTSYFLAAGLFGTRVLSFVRLFQGGNMPEWPCWIFAQNVTMGLFNSFGPIWLAGTWSLAVEEQFYLILPAAVRFLSLRSLTAFAAACVVLAAGTRLAIYYFKFVPGLSAYVLLPSRFDSLGFGVLAAIAIRYRKHWFIRYRRILASSLPVLGSIAIVHGYRPHPYFVKFTFLDHTLLGLFYVGLLIVVVTGPGLRLDRILSSRTMTGLGELAYSTYLIHPILLYLSFRILTGRDPIIDGLASIAPLILALLSTWLFAKLSWIYVEKPLLTYGHKFTY